MTRDKTKSKVKCKKCKSKEVKVYSWAMITVRHDYTCLKCGHKWHVDDDY